MWSGFLKRISRPSARCLRTNSRTILDTPGVQSGRWTTVNRGFQLSTSSNNCSSAAGVLKELPKTAIIRDIRREQLDHVPRLSDSIPTSIIRNRSLHLRLCPCVMGCSRRSFNCFDLLLRQSFSWFPHSSPDSASRPSQFTLLYADDRHVRCTCSEWLRSCFGLSLAPTQQVSNQRLLDLKLLGMFRSIASSLIFSARNLF